MRALVRLLTVLFAALFAVTLVVPATASAPSTDIRDRLEQIPGLSVVEAEAPEGYRFFRMTFTQPADHRNPAAGTFEQRLTLLHRDVSRPMVMYTSGYNVSPSPHRSEPTRIVDGNELGMEYRYFTPSRPEKTDWPRQLTIRQAAIDQHRVITAFKRIYHENWLTTGGSKGGMTATYHRRFFPNDVSGTVPYVAPNDVVDPVDRYNRFLSRVGTKECRTKLVALRRATLQQRPAITRIAKAEVAKNGYTYDTVGSLDKAMEASVVDAFFAFWQYQPTSACADIPAPTASPQRMYDYYTSIDVPLALTYSDQGLKGLTPYYFQAAYQLGSPEPYERNLRDLLRYPGLDVARTFVPDEVEPKRFDYVAMPDIDFWVRTRSQRMLYVYGANDPWGAEPFRCGRRAAARDCHRYFAHGENANHGSEIALLPPGERAEATALVRKWAGVGGEATTRSLTDTNTPAGNPALDANPLLRERPRL